jgi:hypothetical protein
MRYFFFLFNLNVDVVFEYQVGFRVSNMPLVVEKISQQSFGRTETQTTTVLKKN